VKFQAIKRVSTTIFSFIGAEALDAVLMFFEAIVDTLINNRDLEGSCDSKFGSTTCGLNFFFLRVLSQFEWYYINTKNLLCKARYNN